MDPNKQRSGESPLGTERLDKARMRFYRRATGYHEFKKEYQELPEPTKNFYERLAEMREKTSFFPTNLNTFWERLKLSMIGVAAFYYMVKMCIIVEKTTQAISIEPIMCIASLIACFYMLIRNCEKMWTPPKL